MANTQTYTGTITAAYVNLSKKNKDYATGYIQLPDANGANQSYKFLLFDDASVAALKAFDPQNLKGKSISMDGEFKENTWNGNTEYQLMVSSLVLPGAESAPAATPELQPGQPTEPATAVPNPAVEAPNAPLTPQVPATNTPVVPTVPTSPEVPQAPSIPSTPVVPQAPQVPTMPQ